jgi:hypothetical protein
MNPLRRPIRRISTVAGMVVTATHKTIMETGKVASAGLPESVDPIIPPSVTMTIEPVAEINWHKKRMVRLRTGMDTTVFRNRCVAFSHIRYRRVPAVNGYNPV